MYTGYVDIFDADNYLEFRLDTRDWDRASEKLKLSALQTASDDIDRLPLKGYRKHKDQERRFPRDFDNGNEVPQAIKNATIELALTYLKGVDAEEEYNLLTRREIEYSAIREQRHSVRVEPHIAAGIPSLRAFELLVPYLRNEQTVMLVRGS